MNECRQRSLEAARELGIPPEYVTQCRLPSHAEGEDLVSVGLDMLGREQRLERRTATQWQGMRQAAVAEQVALEIVSGFRSFDYQKGIIARKLAAGQAIQQILTVSALPGFSEHHTGRAIDIGTPGSPPLEEEFERTAAFQWLRRRAPAFGFRMSYPRDNPLGIIYEPWHWFWHELGPETRTV